MRQQWINKIFIIIIIIIIIIIMAYFLFEYIQMCLTTLCGGLCHTALWRSSQSF